MKTLRSHLIGIDQGDVEVFSEFAEGGAMWTGAGPRERRRAVRFARAFRAPPAVHVSLSLWDMDREANIRAEVVAEAIATDGCDLVFRTWSDSRVARARLAWLAIGELPSDDDWQLD
ncbi:H-type lectin domain-containing protein [Roseivivax sp. CAU 1761]